MTSGAIVQLQCERLDDDVGALFVLYNPRNLLRPCHWQRNKTKRNSLLLQALVQLRAAHLASPCFMVTGAIFRAEGSQSLQSVIQSMDDFAAA